MRISRSWRSLVAASLGAALVIGLSHFAITAEKGSKKDSGDNPKQAESKDDAKQADPYAVPDGSAEELVQFLEKLQQKQPRRPDPKAAMEFREKAAPAMFKAAEKLLASKPNEKQAELAAMTKAGVLQMRGQTGDADARKQLQALPAELEKAGWTKAARRVRGMALQFRLIEARSGGPEQLPSAIEEVKRFVAGGSLGQDEVRLAMIASQLAERGEDAKLALSTNEHFGQLLSKSKTKQIARFGARLQGTARRLGLMGKELTLEGTVLDGKPLDWSKFRGKVVLVDFWATWCGPCREEIENILKNYDEFHARGFEVVGISVDEDRDALETFVKEKKLPWTVVVDHELEKGDDDKSMATRYGINGIPEVMLVGRDGKVLSREVRGEALGQQLEKLLGPAKVKKEGKKEKKESESEK